jgi:hypothetical protein
MKLRRLLFECECGVISNSLEEYAAHAEKEMVGTRIVDEAGVEVSAIVTDEVTVLEVAKASTETDLNAILTETPK